MFAEWRQTLRRAEHALEQGQLDQAEKLATAPDVRSYRQARVLGVQIAEAFTARAAEQINQGDSRRAWEDLARAERLGGANQQVAELRSRLTRRALDDATQALHVGQLDEAKKRLAELRSRGEAPAELRRIQAVIVAWQEARRMATAGQFAAALAQLDLAGRLYPKAPAIEAERQVVAARAEQLGSMESDLYRALTERNWPAVLARSDAIRAIAPEHVAARAARRQAWLGAGIAASQSRRAVAGASKSDPSTSAEPRFLLWVDGVGGYLVCCGSRVSVGQPTEAHVDIPLMADLSRQHASIDRDAAGYVVRTVRRASINGKPVRGEASLADGDCLTLGQSVHLRFHRPSRVTATARLALESDHRLPFVVDGVLLMADQCILGGDGNAHVRIPDLRSEIVLCRQDGALWCRADAGFEVDGRPCRERARLEWNSRIRGEGFSFAIELLKQGRPK